MGVSKRKTKMVNFRLSEQEYDELKQLCEREGFPSLSDFARTAMKRPAAGQAGPAKADWAHRASSLERKVLELDRAVKDLGELLAVGSPR